MYCRPELCWLRGGGQWRNLLLFPFSAPASLRVCAKTSAGQEACFQQNIPHPDPPVRRGTCLGFVQKQVPDRRRISNKTTLTLTLSRPTGEGTGSPRLSQLPKRLDTPTDGGRFSLSHPMGEGRGEGERASKSEVVFARVLRSAADRLNSTFKKRPVRGPGLQDWSFSNEIF
jgi:hypothetical protein